jgi:hypothetical protein
LVTTLYKEVMHHGVSELLVICYISGFKCYTCIYILAHATGENRVYWISSMLPANARTVPWQYHFEKNFCRWYLHEMDEIIT